MTVTVASGETPAQVRVNYDPNVPFVVFDPVLVPITLASEAPSTKQCQAVAIKDGGGG